MLRFSCVEYSARPRPLDGWEEIERPVASVLVEVLARAAAPLPTVLATLDAIHLASALVWREITGEELIIATNDPALARAARAQGFSVLGV